MTARIWTAVLAAAASLALVGCGGPEEVKTPQLPPDAKKLEPKTPGGPGGQPNKPVGPAAGSQ